MPVHGLINARGDNIVSSRHGMAAETKGRTGVCGCLFVLVLLVLVVFVCLLRCLFCLFFSVGIMTANGLCTGPSSVQLLPYHREDGRCFCI